MHRKVNSTSSVSSTMLVSARYLTNMFYIGLSLKSLEQNCFLQHLQYFQWALEGGVKGGSSMQHMAGRWDSAGTAFRPFQLPGVIMFGVEPSERRSGRASPLLPSYTPAAVLLSIVSLKSSTTSACNAPV